MSDRTQNTRGLHRNEDNFSPNVTDAGMWFRAGTPGARDSSSFHFVVLSSWP